MNLDEQQVRRLLARDTRFCRDSLNFTIDYIDSISSRCSGLGERNIAQKLEDILLNLYKCHDELGKVWEGEPPLFDD